MRWVYDNLGLGGPHGDRVLQRRAHHQRPGHVRLSAPAPALAEAAGRVKWGHSGYGSSRLAGLPGAGRPHRLLLALDPHGPADAAEQVGPVTRVLHLLPVPERGSARWQGGEKSSSVGPVRILIIRRQGRHAAPTAASRLRRGSMCQAKSHGQHGVQPDHHHHGGSDHPHPPARTGATGPSRTSRREVLRRLKLAGLVAAASGLAVGRTRPGARRRRPSGRGRPRLGQALRPQEGRRRHLRARSPSPPPC